MAAGPERVVAALAAPERRGLARRGRVLGPARARGANDPSAPPAVVASQRHAKRALAVAAHRGVPVGFPEVGSHRGDADRSHVRARARRGGRGVVGPLLGAASRLG